MIPILLELLDTNSPTFAPHLHQYLSCFPFNQDGERNCSKDPTCIQIRQCHLIVASCQTFSRYFGLQIRPFFKFQVFVVLGNPSMPLLVHKKQKFQHCNALSTHHFTC